MPRHFKKNVKAPFLNSALKDCPIRVEVWFGQPSKGCVGSGICRVELESAKAASSADTPRRCCAVPALAVLEPGRFILIFQEQNFCRRWRREGGPKESYPVLEAPLLGERLRAQMELNGLRSGILPGAYPLIRRGKQFLLILDMESY